jgi:adenylate cyclase
MRSRGFRGQVVISVLALLTLVQASGFLAVTVVTTQDARSQLHEELVVGGRVFARLLSARTEQLADAARLLSGDFAFKTAVSTEDRATVVSVLENHQARIGADVMMLVSLDGIVIAETLDLGPVDRPLPFPTLVARAEEAHEASAVVSIDGDAYRMVVVPLLAPLPIGWICIGFRIDDRLAKDLQALTMLHVSFLRPHGGGFTTVASTLPSPARDELLRSVPRTVGKPDASISLQIGEGEYATLIASLGDADGDALVAVLQRSLEEALQPLRRLQRTLLAVAAAGLLVSFGTGIMLARRVTKPVLTLAESARRIERGDYGHPVAIDQQDEIGELAKTFNHMTRGLAERDRVRDELARVGRLKRFFSPQLAELIVSSGDEAVLASHRREITVVFCDLRGFTAFAEAADPGQVMGALREFHDAVGPLIFQHEGTLERFTGDGLMVFFNDPVPCPDPAARAVRMAVAMRQRVGELVAKWQQHGYTLGFGMGIAAGEATLGRIGFEGRLDYAAIGPVSNLSARLCQEATDGQILVSEEVYAAVHDLVVAEAVGPLPLKGFARAVTAFNIVGLATCPSTSGPRTAPSMHAG